MRIYCLGYDSLVFWFNGKFHCTRDVTDDEVAPKHFQSPSVRAVPKLGPRVHSVTQLRRSAPDNLCPGLRKRPRSYPTTTIKLHGAFVPTNTVQQPPAGEAVRCYRPVITGKCWRAPINIGWKVAAAAGCVTLGDLSANRRWPEKGPVAESEEVGAGGGRKPPPPQRKSSGPAFE